MGAYERALERLHQVALADFVAERERLAAELRARGNARAAAELRKRRRPPLSAWAVNQLYWRVREAFEDMLASAAKLRAGNLDATGEYRRTLADLRARAAAILVEVHRPASDAVLARISTTLAAIAASGFAPDAPGTLARDRDPPGFDAAVAPGGRAPHRSRQATASAGHDAVPRALHAARKDVAAAPKRSRQAEQAERRRRAAEAARRERAGRQLARKLAAARTAVARGEKSLASLRARVRAAEQIVAKAQARQDDLTRSLHALEREQ